MLKSPLLRIAAGYVALAVVVGAIASLGGGEKKKPLTPTQKRAKRADVGGPFPLELRSPTVVAGTSQRVLVALRRPSLGQLMARTRQSSAEQRAYVRSLHREERALMSALEAKGVRFGDPVLYARVWSGFAATVATDKVPEVQTLGLRVEPVARFYPAQVVAKKAPEVRPLPTKVSHPGPIAVIDAFPRTRANASTDFVKRAGSRAAPGEAAGARMVAVVRGELPTADVLEVRAAGNQPLESGTYQVFGTTDQLISALERVVDPDEDGDASDAVPVALIGLAAPYSGFADSPAATAVDAATGLGTLVVAPAGNGGQAGDAYGTISDPGAARTALTVGALDGSGKVAPASSRGPTYSLTLKPDLAIGGGGKTAFGTAWGTGIAAARVAGVAAALRAERPSLSPAEAAGALVGTAAERGRPFAAGGGDPLLQAARVTPLSAVPPSCFATDEVAQHVRIHNLSNRPLEGFAPFNQPQKSIPPHRSQAFGGCAGAPAGRAARFQVGAIRVPLDSLERMPPPPPIGSPRIIRRKGKPAGVRFVAGSIKRNPKGQNVLPVQNLVLTLEGPDKRELTPPGGARDLLPGEYAYTLTGEILRALPAGRYRFVVRVSGRPGIPSVTRSSRPFILR